MWQVHGNKVALRVGILIAAGCLFSHVGSAIAEEANGGASNFSLPGVSLSQGADEVRAADGTSCRSSLGGSGAYVDMGLIGKQGVSNNGSYYGRVVMPLGKGPKRLDCSKLYELEVERLRLELELAKAGFGTQTDPSLDQTETSSVDEEPAPTKKAKSVVAAEDVEPSKNMLLEAPEEAAPVKKKKAAKVAEAEAEPVEEAPKPVKAAKVAKLKMKKVGNADWANEGWSTEGRLEN